MCGIAGIVDYQRRSDELISPARAMRRALRHRGPDGEGEHIGTHVVLEHTRLAIEDEQGGQQPLLSPDGRFLLVYNGELYGTEALRARLAREYPFQGSNDVEVVMAALALEGPRALATLDGMFALFLWDLEKGEGIAARDRLGVKPLVYSFEGGQLRFASEAKALLASGLPPRIHLPTFTEWVVMPSMSSVEHGMFEGIEVLPPGHALRVSREGVRLERFASFDHAPPWVDEGRLLDELPRLVWVGLGSAAETNASTGVLLSGGLDSSLVAMASQWHHDSIPAFSASFQDKGSFDYSKSLFVGSDDEEASAELAKLLELPLHRVEISRRTLAEDLDSIAAIDDRLPAWEQQITQHHLFRAARKMVKVVLVGDAADETHYGYHFLLSPEASASAEGLMDRLGAPIRLSLLASELRSANLLPELAEKYRLLAGPNGNGWRSVGRLSREERVLATSSLVLKRWLPRLLHNGDIHSMAFGLEARVPFASGELLEVAQRIPPRIGMKEGVEKWHLRQAMGGELPDSIRWRRKSALPKDLGAGPVYQAEAARVLEAPHAALERCFDLSSIRVLADRRHVLSELERSMLFQVLVFDRWARHYEVL